MQKIIERVGIWCVENEIVHKKDVCWLVYGLIKRILAGLALVPFFFLTAIITDWGKAAGFLFSFYILRSRINGYHAKSIGGCFIQSIAVVFIFWYYIYSIMLYSQILTIAGLYLPVIWFLAPYNHPQMHYSDKELHACRLSARKRVVIILTIYLVARCLSFQSLCEGLAMGTVLAGTLLLLAYFLEWRKMYEKLR